MLEFLGLFCFYNNHYVNSCIFNLGHVHTFTTYYKTSIFEKGLNYIENIKNNIQSKRRNK